MPWSSGGWGQTGVVSFAGRTGPVQPTAGDYTAAMVGAVSTSGGSVIAPAAGTTALQINVPAGSGGQAFYINDVAGNEGFCFALEYYGGTAGGNPGFDIKHMSSSLGIAFALHGYNNTSPHAEVDNCGTGTMLTFKNTEHAAYFPGGNAYSSTYMGFQGYVTPTTSPNGDITQPGGAGTSYVLTDTTTPAAFVPEDAGKAIRVGAVATKISAVNSATQVTLAATSGLTVGSGQTYSYIPLAGLGILGELQPENANVMSGYLLYEATTALGGFKFKAQAGVAVPLTVEAASGSNDGMQILLDGTSTGRGLYINGSATTQSYALEVEQAAAATAVLISQAGAATGLVVDSAAAGNYAAVFTNSADVRGVSISSSGNVASTPTLYVQKNGTGAGLGVEISNLGTGPALQVDAGGAYLMQITASGALNFASSLSAATATAGTAALPADPVGFIMAQVNGVTAKIPYYAA